MSDENAEEILATYKKMMGDCQQIASKISEVREMQFDSVVDVLILFFFYS
jgi:hypothetical protein